MRTNKANQRWARGLLDELGPEERAEHVERAALIRGKQWVACVWFPVFMPVLTLLLDAAGAALFDQPFEELRAGDLYLRLTTWVLAGCAFLLLVHRGRTEPWWPSAPDAPRPPPWTLWLPLGAAAPFLAAPAVLLLGVDGGGPLFLFSAVTGVGLILYVTLRRRLLVRPLTDDRPTARLEVALRSTSVCASAGIMTGFALVQLAGLVTYLERGAGVGLLDVVAAAIAVAGLAAGAVVMRLPLRSVLPERQPAVEPVA